MINYNLGPLIYNIYIDQLPILNELLDERGYEKVYENFTGAYMLKKSLGLSYSYVIPPEVDLKSLSFENADYIDKTWPHRYSESAVFIRNQIEFNGGFGLFRKSDGALISWIIKNEFSGVGCVHSKNFINVICIISEISFNIIS